MQMSARILGQEYGMTAEEMNRVLWKEGFLSGEPGDYNLTDKAMRYAEEKDYHRGCGGYQCYNRFWTTRTFDESIKEELNITPGLKSEIRREISVDRAAKQIHQINRQIEDSKGNLTKQIAVTKNNAMLNADILKKAGTVGSILAGGIIIGYGIYKLTPIVKKWRNDRKKS